MQLLPEVIQHLVVPKITLPQQPVRQRGVQ